MIRLKQRKLIHINKPQDLQFIITAELGDLKMTMKLMLVLCTVMLQQGVCHINYRLSVAYNILYIAIYIQSMLSYMCVSLEVKGSYHRS